MERQTGLVRDASGIDAHSNEIRLPVTGTQVKLSDGSWGAAVHLPAADRRGIGDILAVKVIPETGPSWQDEYRIVSETTRADDPDENRSVVCEPSTSRSAPGDGRSGSIDADRSRRHSETGAVFPFPSRDVSGYGVNKRQAELILEGLDRCEDWLRRIADKLEIPTEEEPF